MTTTPEPLVEMTDFTKIEMRIGTILSAEPNPAARHPALILRIDFGECLGVKTTSAQITENHDPMTLLGTQVIAVVNFPEKRIAGIKSQVLVLAAVSEHEGTVLITPTRPVSNGSRIL